MDDIDERILDLLGEDARSSYKKIAEKIGISDVSVKKRVDKLLSDGIIRRFTIGVDPTLTGSNIRASVDLDIEPTKIDDVIGNIRKMKEFYSVWRLVGEHDLNLRGSFRDIKHMNEVIEQTTRLGGVIKYHISILAQQEKDRTYVYATPKNKK